MLDQFCERKSFCVRISIKCCCTLYVGSEHAHPGEPYCGLYCTFYLPNNPTGQEVCNLLRAAFDARLMFTVDKSAPSAGDEYKIICNGIELKTNRDGGPAK